MPKPCLKACFYKQYTITQGECVRQKTQMLKKSGFVPETRPARQRPSRHGLLLRKNICRLGTSRWQCSHHRKVFRCQMDSGFFISTAAFFRSLSALACIRDHAVSQTGVLFFCVVLFSDLFFIYTDFCMAGCIPDDFFHDFFRDCYTALCISPAPCTVQKDGILN
mgnify:FL=1